MTNLVLLRRQMVEIGRRLQQQNLIVAAEGNLSVRLGGRAFLVTPSGVGKGALRVQDLLEIDLAGRCARGKPSSEWPLHRCIYEARPDVGAIFHGHDRMVTAQGAALNLPETKEEKPSGSVELLQQVMDILGDEEFLVMKNHGFLALGSSMEEAGQLALRIKNTVSGKECR